MKLDLAPTGPPRSLLAFAKGLPATEGDDLESAGRQPSVMPAFVQMLGSDLSPIGDSFPAVTHSLSSTSLSLLSTRSVTSRFLEITITGPTNSRQVKMRVIACRTIRRFYQIVGELVAD